MNTLVFNTNNIASGIIIVNRVPVIVYYCTYSKLDGGLNMLRVKLKELLESNNTSISELSEKTGINRRPLTQLANNESKMVKFETLDKIMDFFDINDLYELFDDSPSGLIVFTLVDFNDSDDFTVALTIRDKKSPASTEMGSIKINFHLEFLKKLSLTMIVGKIDHSDQFSTSVKFINKMLYRLNSDFMDEMVATMLINLFQGTTLEQKNRSLSNSDSSYSKSIFQESTLERITQSGKSFSLLIDELPPFTKSGELFLVRENDTFFVDNDNFFPLRSEFNGEKRQNYSYRMYLRSNNMGE